MQINNVTFLKKNFPKYYDLLKSNEHHEEITLFQEETLRVKRDDVMFDVTSRYSKEYEAEVILSKLGEIDKKSLILFVGVADGFLLDYVSKRHPKSEIRIFEPSF